MGVDLREGQPDQQYVTKLNRQEKKFAEGPTWQASNQKDRMDRLAKDPGGTRGDDTDNYPHHREALRSIHALSRDPDHVKNHRDAKDPEHNINKRNVDD